ncbi:DUF2834 domain-containing protein [Nissabacter sp. SGAir0207]|uniref:DUF2834 domain-containing protein n=1 Tax=Nissabacter sp. SGAir0207 TaxID=2126321 RepID=UPI0010F78F60|nr:DUF2834 domain-containing protein [Nissabacter sp. SGAir0207]
MSIYTLCITVTVSVLIVWAMLEYRTHGWKKAWLRILALVATSVICEFALYQHLHAI